MTKKVSCVIPVFNEERTVAGVIEVCLKTPEINEIIIVNDGSEDNTKEEIEKFLTKVQIINLSKNKGKGYAVAQGVASTKFKTLLFLDADLINIKPYHLSSLMRPVLNNEVDMTIADLNAGFRKPYSIIWPFSGQRCISKKLVAPLLDKISKAGYGMEIILNEKLKNKRVIVIPIITSKNLHLRKPKKQKDWLAFYIKESWDVFQSMVKLKSRYYRQKAKENFLDELSGYLKINIKKIKEYLEE